MIMSGKLLAVVLELPVLNLERVEAQEQDRHTPRGSRCPLQDRAQHRLHRITVHQTLTLTQRQRCFRICDPLFQGILHFRFNIPLALDHRLLRRINLDFLFIRTFWASLSCRQ
eukprot:g6829.t1